jgi:hypothetical protein
VTLPGVPVVQRLVLGVLVRDVPLDVPHDPLIGVTHDVGVTEFDGAEDDDVPFRFVAVTVNV